MPWRRSRCRYVLANLVPLTHHAEHRTKHTYIVWDSKPIQKGAPTNWVELKTSVEIRDDRSMQNFERKLMKFWIQSFLLGVPKIIVGFRSQKGILTKIEEIKTESIPVTAAQRGVKTWNANMCINFASGFLECKL